MSVNKTTVTASSLVVIATLVLVETVSAFETTMAVQLLYSNDPFFGTDIAQLTWILTAYLLVAAAATGVCGRLGDQFGRVKVLTWVLLISALGSVISALAPNVEVLILGRGVQGVSGAILPLVIGLAREILPDDLVPTSIAVVSSAALIAGSAGLLVSGVIIDHTNWRYIFVIAVFLAVAAVVALRKVIPTSKAFLADRGKVDYVGAVLFSAGVGTALFGVTKSSTWTWTDGRTVGAIGAGLVILAVWAVHELHTEFPMMELRRFTNPKFALGILGTVVIAFGVFGLNQVIPSAIMRTPSSLPLPDGGALDLPVGLGLSATMAGLVGAAGALFGFVIAPFAGRFSGRFGAAYTVMAGCVIAVVGFFAVIHMHSTVPTYMVATFILAAATTLCYGALPTLIVECVPPSETSAAVGMQAVIRTGFQGVASSFAGIFIARDQFKVGDYSFLSQTGVEITAYVAMVAAVVGLAIAYAASRFRGSSLPRHSGGPGSAPEVISAH